jgi:quinol monooxygenase YgiN
METKRNAGNTGSPGLVPSAFYALTLSWNNCCGRNYLLSLNFSPNNKEVSMTNVALLVRLEAKKGKEAEVEQFLKSGLSIVENEPSTISWYALKLGPSTYGIFDTFPDDDGRNAHLTGDVAKALMAKAPDLFAVPPAIEKIDILAAKMAEPVHHS